MPLIPPSDLNPRTDPPLDFADKEFGDLTAADYDVLGFLGGLEVHQQLDTESKLFCRCPAGRYTDQHDAEVLRHMRPTLSELGEYDGTALMEFKTKKEIIYRLNRRNVCTYEIDDTPPFEIGMEAVEIAIEQALLLDLNLVSELHVMRKQYLDGSIPTGFQRTAMIGLGGAIPFMVPELGVDRELTIRQLSLEEDSCREVSDVGHRIVFNTDRLGMPLSEAVTEPELLTPLEMRAAGRLLARVARATGKVRRGAGAGRQDVNVSIAGGRRVEIKGVPHHLGMPRLVHVEAFRQLNLLRIRAALHERGVTRDMLAIPEDGLPWDVSNLVADVTCENAIHGIRVAVQLLEPDDVIAAVRLPGFAGLLDHRTQPGLDFSHEISERVRVIACPVARPFMVHSDQDGADSVVRWKDVREMVGAESGDAIVIVWMPRRDAATAVREVLIRAQDALVGVPSETRQAHRNGTNGFERILPGADRMYPDTDTPPLPIADDVVERISANLPERPWDREQRYEALGLSAAEARWVATSLWGEVYDAFLGSAKGIERRLAYAIDRRSSIVDRRCRRSSIVNRLTPIVAAVRDGLVRVEALSRMIDLAVTTEQATDDIIARHAPSDTETMDRGIEDVAAEARAMSGRSAATLERWAMGAAMRRLLGRVDPAELRVALGAALTPATEVRS
jgi:glutamyl-tRNA(Gln) amidotransferase subunit E